MNSMVKVKSSPHNYYKSTVKKLRVKSHLTQALGRLACTADDDHTVAGSNTQFDGVPPFACCFGKTRDTCQLLATADEDGYVCLYDTRGASKLVKEWSAHNNAIFDLKWADTEPWVLTAAGDQTAALWDVSRGCRLAVFRQHSSSLKSASFRPGDRNVFATGARDGRIMVWDIRCNHREGDPSYHTPVNTIVDCHEVAAPSTPKPAKRQRLASTPALSKSSVTAVVFQDEFSLISAGSTESTIKVWDIRTIYKKSSRTPSPKQEFPYCGNSTSTKKVGFSSLVLNSSRSCVYASCTDDVIYAFNCVGNNAYPTACYMGHSNKTFYVKSALSVDDMYLLSGSSDNKAYIWKVSEPCQDPIQLVGHDAEVTSVAWSSVDFPKLATCADDNSFRVWRLHNFQDDELTKNKDVVGNAVREKLKPRASPALSPCPSPGIRPPSRGCVSQSPFTNLQSKPELKKVASIKTFFTKKRPAASLGEPTNNNSTKTHKLDETDTEKTKENNNQQQRDHNLATNEITKEGESMKEKQICLPRACDVDHISVCNKQQSLPRIPLSPRKDVHCTSTAVKDELGKDIHCTSTVKDKLSKDKRENTVTFNSKNSCKENQRVDCTTSKNGGGARKMLSWPNSVEFGTKMKPSSINPCRGCKVFKVSPVKRTRTGKITGYFRRLSKDKASHEGSQSS